MNTRKKTALGILGAAATTAFVLGATAPALADDTTQSWSADTTQTKTRILESLGLSNESPVVVAPEVSTGDVHTGDVLSGVLSGNDVGNDNVVGSANDTAIGSGNHTAIDGVDLDASDLFDSTVGDVTGDVSDLLDELDVTLDTMFED